MSDFWHILKARRSIRRYEPREVPHNLVEAVLEAAIWAPSAHNRQPWRFAVVQGDEARVRLARAMGERLRADLTRDGAPTEAIEADVARSYDRLTSAPVVIVVSLSMVDMDTYPDPVRQQHEWTMAVQSVAMAGQNLLLAAHAAGLAGCWMCAPLFCPEVVRAALDLPTDWEPQGLITLGYPAQARTKTRQPFNEKVVWRK